MNTLKSALCTALLTSVLTVTGTALADAPETVSQAVNLFQNGKATGGSPFTVDVGKSVKISDEIELPGFAFNVYDIDFTENSLTMTLVAELSKLQITLYDDTTFDRYYFAFDKEITSVELAESTDENFRATVEIIEPGMQTSSKGSFVDGLATEFDFENGGILITIGEGTDLTKIKNGDGSLTVNF